MIWTWLKWMFSIPGIQYSNKKPLQVTLFGKKLFWLSRHPGVGYLPGGPTAQELMIWSTMERYFHRTFKAYHCKFCNTTVWSYKPVQVCESFACFKANGGKWK